MRGRPPLPDFDCYAELGVEPWADREAIDAAWRRAMRSVHPDLAGSDAQRAEATARAARLNVAREWLTDTRRRADYDAVRWPRDPRPAPDIDPLGAWPPRRRPPRPPASVAPAIALLGVMGVLAALFMGPGAQNLSASGLLLLSLMLIAFYAAWWLLGGRGRPPG